MPQNAAGYASVATDGTMEPWKFKNVLGYEFLSTTFVLHTAGGAPIEERVDGVAEIVPGTLLTKDLIREHCAAVFSRLPASAVNADVFVFSHNGNCPSALVQFAVDFASFYLSLETKVYVICDTIAFARVALRHLKCSTSDGSDSVFLAIVNGGDGRFLMLERSKEHGWGVVDSVKVSFATTDELLNLLSMALSSYPTTTTRLLLTDRAPLSLKHQMKKMNIQMLIKSFGDARSEGILDFADSVADSDVNRRQRDLMATVYFKQSFGALQELTADGQMKFSQNVAVDPSLGGFKIFQRISTFSSAEYILFEASDVPAGCNSIQITITNEPFSVPTIELMPSFASADHSFIFSPHVPTDVSLEATTLHASSVDSLKPTMRKNNQENVKPPTIKPNDNILRFNHLRSIGAEVSINFDITFSTVLIEFIGHDGLKVITDLNGFTSIPFFVSFANKQPRVGLSALVDFKKHPKRVVWDLLHILGRDVNDVVVNPKWTFGISQASTSNNTAMIEFEMTRGRRVMTTPSWITAIFLRAVQKLVQTKTGVTPCQFFFQIPLKSPPQMQAAIEEACSHAGIVFAGSEFNC